MPVLIAAVFIGWYFYKSATNIDKNGFLWVGIAVAAFISTTILTTLVLRYFLESIFGNDPENSLLLGYFLGMAIGVISLFAVNYYMNQIPD